MLPGFPLSLSTLFRYLIFVCSLPSNVDNLLLNSSRPHDNLLGAQGPTSTPGVHSAFPFATRMLSDLCSRFLKIIKILNSNGQPMLQHGHLRLELVNVGLPIRHVMVTSHRIRLVRLNVGQLVIMVADVIFRELNALCCLFNLHLKALAQFGAAPQFGHALRWDFARHSGSQDFAQQVLEDEYI